MATPFRRPGDRLAADQEFAAVELGQAGDAAQERGLAAAARADDAEDFLVADGKIERAERRHGAVEKQLARVARDDHAGIDAEQIECATDRLVDDVVHALRARIEAGHRRHHDRAVAGRLVDERDVAGVQRRLAEHQDQAAAFLEAHVGGAHDQVVRIAVGDPAQSFHRARRDQHALGAERAARDRSAHILVTMHDVRKGTHVIRHVVGFLHHCACRGGRDDQVGFENLETAQKLERAHAIDDPGRPGYRHNQPSGLCFCQRTAPEP